MRMLRILTTLGLVGLFAVPVTAQAVPTCFGREATIVSTSGNDVPLLGTADVDVIVGRGGDDQIFPGDGDDFVCEAPGDAANVDGGSGNDQIKGGPGSDELQGGLGDDRLLGGEEMFGDDGNDYLRAPNSSGGWALDGGPGTDTCVGEANDRYTDCEVIRIRA